MRNKTLLSFLSIIFLSLLFIGQSFANDKASSEKNIGKFISVSENGNQKDLQGESIARITGKDVGDYTGDFTHPYNENTVNYWAGTFNGSVDGSAVNFYCIDIDNYLIYNEDYTDEGETPIEITYILNNYYPYVSFPYNNALSTEAQEASAIQATLWHYADDLDPSTLDNDEIRDRVNEIIADVTANAGSAVYPDYFTITPSYRDLVDGTTADFEILAFDTDGNPFVGLVVNLETTSGILSDAQVTTDANGVASFTLSQDGGNLATISAVAQVTIPQGTQYFHVERPDGQQKLVLATPTVANGSASADVNWYTPGDCDLHNYTTYTIGGWGGPSNGTPGGIRNDGFDTVFPNDLVIGGNGFTLTLTSADAVKDFLPSGSTAGALDQDYVNPTGVTSAGVFADQLIAATLNIYYHDGGYLGSNTTPLGDLVFDDGVFEGMSLYDFLAIANDAIGGNTNTGYTYSELSDAATAINENFDDGTVNEGDLTCAVTPPDCKSTLGDYIWHDKNVNGIQDNNEVGIDAVVVELYDNGGVLLLSTSTDNTGYYEFIELANGNYTVKVADANFEAGGVFEGSDNEKWYITLANEGDSDELDSNGDEDNSTSVTIDCNDDFTVDFGFFHTCMTFSKTGPESAIAGDVINYTFTVTNCGDLVLHGGASVYDPMLSNAADGFLRNKLVEVGESWSFNASHTTTDAECGTTIVNDAWAIGHPMMPDGSYKENIRYDDSHSVDVSCVEKATLGDRVWYDTNEDGIQDLGEDGVQGVVVNLYDCSNLFITSTNTDIDGYYLFEDLELKSYYVEFVLPTGYLFTLQNEGSDSSLDSDADPLTGKTVCSNVLVAGEVDLTWDAGIYVEQSGNDFDLSILKSASNTTPDDEDIITYTITVTNNSSIDGTDIVVSDILPAGLIYQSASSVDYDETSGLWDVGDIDAGDSKSIDITVKVDYLSLGEAPIFDLGIAAPFNLFVIKDVVQPSSDTEGRVAVGRNATFGNYSVGDKLPLSGGTEDVLIVGRKLTFTSGQVYAGNVVYGKYIDVSQQNLCSDGSIRKENPVPVDFAQAETELNSLSVQLATRPATGTTTFEWGGLNLTGTEPILNVFEVDGNDLSASNSMEINVPNGSVVLVNINRRDVSWGPSGVVVNGTAIGNVIYNFHQASKLKIQGIDIRGSVLAPKAKVNFVAGVINGQMICKYFEGQGQMNNSQFHGSIYGNPEIVNCAEITEFGQEDVDLSNNISCAPIVVNVDYDPNNGDDGDEGNQWVEAGGTGLSEMIWSMCQVNSGLLVGTVGGNIYLNNGPDFTLLNEEMDVVYIWSLYDYNSIIYAGTELGLYRYDGAVWTKVALDGDVRSITSIDNVLYAAVWGVGVFSSSDNGATWVAMNEGLIMSGYAVQTLVVANGDLFVGTFGLGVLRFDFDSNSWVELPVGFPHIWMLATDANGNIYAATAGGGVYASADNGENWGAINSGLSNMHIYSVSVYGNDVYVSTWTGGVYKFVTGTLGKANSGSPSIQTTPIVGNWSSLGMGGIEVSSIMVDPSTQTLYAGTSSGTIFQKLDGTTDVNPNEVLPTKFGLEQNYPNPFNPSTKIEFSIAKAGLYAVKVFNVLGQEVAIIANQDFSAGNYTFNFDASNLTSGIYFYKLVGDNVNITKKMMLLK